MSEKMNERLGKILNEDIDDDNRVYISQEAVNINTLEIFDLHDDVDRHKKTNLFIVIELLLEDTICEPIVVDWHLELSQIGFVGSTMEGLFVHICQIC